MWCAGAAGLQLKDTALDALRDSVRTVAGGDALLSPAVTSRVLAAGARAGRAPSGASGSRTRARGPRPGRRRPVERRDRCGAAPGPDTARTYVSRLLTKLHARDRSRLVVIAYESGLVRPGENHG